MMYRFLTTCALVGAATCASLTSAQEATSKPAPQTANENQSQQQQIEKQIEQLSQKIELTSEQKQQLTSQLTEANKKSQETWQQFGEAHAQVIRLEAEMRASLEGIMEPHQKQKAQQNRQDKVNASDTTSNRSVSNGANRNQQLNSKPSDKQGANDQSVANGSTDNSSTSPTAGQKDAGQKDQGKPAKGQDANGHSKAASHSTAKQGQTEEYVWTTIIVPVQGELEPLGLSDAQCQQCEGVYSSYHQSLVKGWQKIERLHDKLVAMEAQNILDIEKVLTSDQIKKLRDSSATKDNSKGAEGSKSKS
jgi:hypothetical protein